MRLVFEFEKRSFFSTRMWNFSFLISSFYHLIWFRKKKQNTPQDAAWKALQSNGWSKIFWTECLFTFDQLEDITDESKAMSSNQNFVLFSNMNSEILYNFLFKASEIIFDKTKKISLDQNFFCTLLYFHYYSLKLKVGIIIYISVCRSEAALKNALFEIFLSFDEASQFFFFLNTCFWKLDFFTKTALRWKEVLTNWL